MRKQHNKQFKEDAVKHYIDHKELTLTGCAKNLSIGGSTLSKWLRESNGENGIQVRGSGKYGSDELKEISLLKWEPRDTKDALDILKKAISILGS